MDDAELAARLAFAYGGGEWLIETPVALLRALAEHLGQLEAEASLRRVAEVAIASGTAKKEMRERMMRTWHKAARGGNEATRKVTTAADFEAMARDLNIEWIKVPATKGAAA